MKLQILSVTTILVLVILMIVLFRINLPLCYNTFEKEKVQKTFILYDKDIVDIITKDIQSSPFHFIRIIGFSMSPVIDDGDTCVCIPKEDYHKGDIISFYVPVGDNVELIAHRIDGVSNGHFTTKGDNNEVVDDWSITKDQIFCKIPETNLFDKFKFAIVDSGGEFSIFNLLG